MTNDKDSAVLAPCSCAKAPVHFENAYGTGYVIHCPEYDDCMVGTFVVMETKEQAIAAWNKCQPTQSAERLEGYLTGLHDLKALTAEEDAFRASQPTQSDALRDLLEEARDRIDEMVRNSGHDYELDWTPEEETLLGRIDAALKEQSNG